MLNTAAPKDKMYQTFHVSEHSFNEIESKKRSIYTDIKLERSKINRKSQIVKADNQDLIMSKPSTAAIFDSIVSHKTWVGFTD